jgi:hypothetical protein
MLALFWKSDIIIIQTKANAENTKLSMSIVSFLGGARTWKVYHVIALPIV